MIETMMLTLMRLVRGSAALSILLSLMAAVQADASGAFSSDRLRRLDQSLHRYVDDGRVAGAVALVLQDGKPVYSAAMGWADKEAGIRMQPDTLFRIASQSKAITSATALSLMEEGRLELANPVSELIPAFAQTHVAEMHDGQLKIVPASRPITIFDLLTHTSGLSYGVEPQIANQYQKVGLGPAAGYGWYLADKDEDVCTSMERLAKLPFLGQPGERFIYGYSIDVLGCVVARAAGKQLDEVVRERLTRPLQMNDTFFFVPAEKRSRLAAVYSSTADGHIQRAPDGALGQGHYIEGPRKDFSGGAGLVSTAQDYARFLEMLRRDGEIDGHRILSPHAVALMRTNQIPGLYGKEGKGFGLGFETVERYGALGMASVGSYGWGGAYGTEYVVDPQEHLVAVLMIQLLPNHSGLEKVGFLNLIYQALTQSMARPANP
jgi:CubicO group peptidase (beta-lactamase class C family)